MKPPSPNAWQPTATAHAILKTTFGNWLTANDANAKTPKPNDETRTTNESTDHHGRP